MKPPKSIALDALTHARISFYSGSTGPSSCQGLVFWRGTAYVARAARQGRIPASSLETLFAALGPIHLAPALNASYPDRVFHRIGVDPANVFECRACGAIVQVGNWSHGPARIRSAIAADRLN